MQVLKHMEEMSRMINLILNLVSTHEDIIEKYTKDNETVEDCKKTIETLKTLSDAKNEVIIELLKSSIRFEDHMPTWCGILEKRMNANKEEKPDPEPEQISVDEPSDKSMRKATCCECKAVFVEKTKGRPAERCKRCRRTTSSINR